MASEVPSNNIENGSASFTKKVWIIVGIAAFVIILLWIFKVAFNALLLIMAGALIAIYFNRLADLIERKTAWKHGVCLAISVIGTLVTIGVLFWFVGYKIQQQLTQLSETLPTTIDNAKTQLGKSSIGRKILESSSSINTQKVTSFASNFFKTSFGVLGDIYIVLFLGIFFTIAPQTYLNGIISLAPKNKEKRTENVLQKVGKTLSDWLKGQLFAMLVVAVLTGIGLTIIGVPMALALAFTAGLLNFIPNFGPLIAMIPAILVGLMQGTNTALLVAGLYILIQALESNLITPSIQNKMINMPPALILIGQLFMGTLAGAWGVVLSTPIVAMLIVLVQELYVKQKNNEK